MADWGLRLWNEDGNITLDFGNDTGRLGGVRSVPAGNGTLAFMVSPGKSPFFFNLNSDEVNYSWGYANGVFTFWLPAPGFVFFGET